MLEYLAIFTQGGALLWTFGQLLNIKGDPINALIRNCLLEDRIGEGGYVYRPTGGTPYTLKWTFHNVRLPHSSVLLTVSAIANCPSRQYFTQIRLIACRA